MPLMRAYTNSLPERQVLIAIRVAPLWQYQFILGPQGFINRAKQRFPIQFYHTLASFVKVTNCSVQEACAIAIGGDARTPRISKAAPRPNFRIKLLHNIPRRRLISVTAVPDEPLPANGQLTVLLEAKTSHPPYSSAAGRQENDDRLEAHLTKCPPDDLVIDGFTVPQ